MSSVYAPRSTLCVPDNACSLAIISTMIDVSLESEKSSSCVIIKSENVDEVEEDDTENNEENVEEPDNEKNDISCDLVLLATGRKPNTYDIGLEELGIKFSNSIIGLLSISISNSFFIKF